MVDQFSRYTWAKPVNESAQTLTNYLQSLPELTALKQVISDNAKSFTSKHFLAWAADRGITTITASKYHPQANGMVERKIRDIKTFMSFYPNYPGGWKMCLRAAIAHCNSSYHATIGCTPYFKAYGKTLELPADRNFHVKPPAEVPLNQEQVMKRRERQQRAYNQRNSSRVPNYKPGDQILVDNHKSLPDGPFTVDGVFEVPKTLRYTHENKKEKVAARNCQPYYSRNLLMPFLMLTLLSTSNAFQGESPLFWEEADHPVADAMVTITHVIEVEELICEGPVKKFEDGALQRHFIRWCKHQIDTALITLLKRMCLKHGQIEVVGRKKRAAVAAAAGLFIGAAWTYTLIKSFTRTEAVPDLHRNRTAAYNSKMLEYVHDIEAVAKETRRSLDRLRDEVLALYGLMDHVSTHTTRMQEVTEQVIKDWIKGKVTKSFFKLFPIQHTQYNLILEGGKPATCEINGFRLQFEYSLPVARRNRRLYKARPLELAHFIQKTDEICIQTYQGPPYIVEEIDERSVDIDLTRVPCQDKGSSCTQAVANAWSRNDCRHCTS